MSSEEETLEKLDAEFDHYVVDMKPYVLKLPHKLERQRCALWIKKLCEPSGAGTGVVDRKNRNLYAKLLLHMLKRGILEGPFTHKPEAGMLKPLPAYMSIYFDEPNSTRVPSDSLEDLPDWVMGELGQSDSKLDESWKLSFREESALAFSFYVNKMKKNCIKCAAVKEEIYDVSSVSYSALSRGHPFVLEKPVYIGYVSQCPVTAWILQRMERDGVGSHNQAVEGADG
uniref:Uncharacterized protein n=1 Tax=Sphaerodactylus townsendi TaxID=933632 RepID=A0ACB8EL69_9SAUR